VPQAKPKQGDARTPRARVHRGDVARTVVIVAAVAILLLVLWQLSGVILLIFASILVAILFRSLAEPIERFTPIRSPWSLLLAVITVVLFIAGFSVLLGTQIEAQIRELITQLPDLWKSLEDQLGVANLGQTIANRLQEFLSRRETVANVAGLTLSLFDIILSAALVLVAGVYIAARPSAYRDGFLLLFPGTVRERVARTADETARALRHWLVGQLVAMAIIGVLTAGGLALLGVPSALALGFIAGVTDFVPIVGPIFGAVPAVLLGFSISPTTALWVIALYLLIQQIEGNVVQPIVQRRAVDLPPALTLFALVAFGVLFGPLGVVFATPLAVVVLVAVKQLYVSDLLGETVHVPGEEGKADG
jgi:predicted PurR-regulated permease PerM